MTEASDQSRSRSGHSNWQIDALLLAGLVVLALVLRLIRLDDSLWEDEVRTYQGAMLPLGEVLIHRTQFLYFALAHFTLKFGDSEVMLRVPSVVAGVAGVAALYGFARQVLGRTNAGLAAFILAVSAYHVNKSQEARFYAVVILANILMLWGLWRAVSTDSRKAWVGFVLAANLGNAAQFTVVPYVASLQLAAAVWILWLPRPGLDVKRSRQLLHLMVASFLCYAGLLTSIVVRGSFPFMVTSPSRGAGGDAGETGATTIANAYRLLPGEYLEFLYLYIPRYSTWIGLVLLVIMAVGFVALWKRSPLTAYLMLAQFVLVPLPLFIIFLSHWYHERYFASVYPFYPLLISAGCTFLIDRAVDVFVRVARSESSADPRLRKTLRAIGLAVFLVGYSKISVTDLALHYRLGGIQDWKTIVQFLAPQLEPGDTIAIAGPATYSTQYLPKDKQVFPTSHLGLQYYLPRELEALGQREDAPASSKIQIVGAGSQRQIQALPDKLSTGDVFIITVSFREPERAPHEDLAKLPTVELKRATGLVLRKLEHSGDTNTEQ